MQSKQLRDCAAAERKPNDMRLLDVQMIEQPRHVQRLLPAISCGLARFIAFAVAARIKRNHAKIFLQICHYSPSDPAIQARGTTMQQYNRRTFSAINIANLHAAGVKVMILCRHKWCSAHHPENRQSTKGFHDFYSPFQLSYVQRGSATYSASSILRPLLTTSNNAAVISM